jgi:alkylated DNA repair dioxygenase AlkB
MPTPRKSFRVRKPPAGFRYERNLVTAEEESDLVRHIEKLPLKEFEFHGYLGKRRVISFGQHYNFEAEAMVGAGPIPYFILPLRERVAELAGIPPNDIPHVLVTEYSPGTTIGWHRDRIVFRDVVGVSLISRCVFRMRRRTPLGWERYSALLEPRSVYLLRGPARENWEHSIPAVETLRYSITFRSLK